MTTVIVKGDWSEIVAWLELNIGEARSIHGLSAEGDGWHLRWVTVEDPYSQIAIDCYYQAEIADDRLATLFSLTWL